MNDSMSKVQFLHCTTQLDRSAVNCTYPHTQLQPAAIAYVTPRHLVRLAAAAANN